MNILEIKATVPGAGKTTSLVNAFVKSKLPNRLILTPTNKAMQVCVNKLVLDYGWDRSKAKRSVQTMKHFCKNYITVSRKDIDGNIISEDFMTTTGKKRKGYQQKPYNLFIDEASMLSQFDFDVLFKTCKIQNIVTSGDCLQFEPIGEAFDIYDAEKKTIITKDNLELKALNVAELASFENSKQILLTKSHRASEDSKLVDALEMIKAGFVEDALKFILKEHPAIDCLNQSTDWHIAYTNNKINQLNKMYEETSVKKRYIIENSDKVKELYKGEILEENGLVLRDLNRRLEYEELQSGKRYRLSKWLEDHTKLAFAITAHKLQGSTIKDGDIFIHLDDIIKLADENPDTFVPILQKYLYVAISRAVSINQINIYGYSEQIYDVWKVVHSAKFTKMEAKDIKDDAFKSDDFQEIENWILSNLDYSEWDRTKEDDYEEWRSKSYDNRKERSDKDKSHKAPDPKDIEFAKTHSWKEASANGWSNTKYYRYRKL